MQNIFAYIRKNSVQENLIFTTVLIGCALTLLVLFKVLGLANVGVDLTDEGYYFNWISNPWLYKYYVSQFGYVYYPLYKALGDSVVYLRQANTIISYSLAWMLSYCILIQYFKNTSKSLIIAACTCLALPALFILMIAGHWLPSPSYNSLNFQGCLILAIGLFVSTDNQPSKSLLSMILIGLGGWLVFMAKPSTALVLTVVVAIYFLPNIKKDVRILLGAGLVSIAMLLLSAFLIDGSVIQFIKRIHGGVQLVTIMGAGHGVDSLIRSDFFALNSWFKLKFILLSVVLLISLYAVNSDSNKAKFTLGLGLLITVSMALSQMFNLSTAFSNVPKYHTLIITAITFTALIYLFLAKANYKDCPPAKLILLFLLLPYLFSVGSGNNYWLTAAGASIFWALAGVLLIVRVKPSFQSIVIVVTFVAVVGYLCIYDSIQTPYRQTDPLLQQTAIFVDPHTQEKLLLSSDTAEYLNSLKQLIQQVGFKSKTPVIDLTGHHPGALYFMQAKSIGQAWTIGGYYGSNSLAVLALNQASCEDIANAWLLIEKDGTRHISDDVLRVHGITLDKAAYQKVGILKSQTIRDSGSINKSHPDGVYMHYLFKPLDSKNQTKNCFGHRSKASSQFDVLN
jgi:hypothetical protein